MQKRTFSRSTGTDNGEALTTIEFYRNTIQDPQRTDRGLKLLNNILRQKICHDSFAFRCRKSEITKTCALALAAVSSVVFNQRKTAQAVKRIFDIMSFIPDCCLESALT